MANETYITRENISKLFFQKPKAPHIDGLSIELTERCNNNCIHCSINLPAVDFAAKKKELSGEEIKRILKEAVSLGCLTIRFSGGEPLLREDFEELYIFARKLGLKVLLFTNATLITRHLAKLFQRIPPLIKIEVGVYGMKENSYEATTRTPGSFEAMERGIELLLEYKIPFLVKGALCPSNKSEIDEFEKWAARIPWMDKEPDYAMFFDLRRRRDDAQKNSSIKNIRLSFEEGLRILIRKPELYKNDMKDFFSKFTMLPGERLFICGGGVRGGCMDAYGFLHVCMLLRHPDTAYDLKRGSIQDCITNFFPKIGKMVASDPDYLRRCAKCFLKSLCLQCPAQSWMEHGTLDTPVEYFCEIAHSIAHFLGLLEKNEKAWEVKDWQKRVNNYVNK
ncbi:radical SAM/SPASM domain-containing protein [Candidatus Omnitrophota bacterium]